jgi:hypothetical protein
MKIDFQQYEWNNKPEKYTVGEDRVLIATEPGTDFWQRTYYGFRNDNGHIFAFKTQKHEFSYSISTKFVPKRLFDQCGVIVYQDQDNWFKGSIEFHTPAFSRLGSVVTNLGFSDWATTDIHPANEISMRYRLSRRGSDFCLENSQDGRQYEQMRIFHLHKGGSEIRVGIYACSPLDSSFIADFSDFGFGECQWAPYEKPE